LIVFSRALLSIPAKPYPVIPSSVDTLTTLKLHILPSSTSFCEMGILILRVSTFVIFISTPPVSGRGIAKKFTAEARRTQRRYRERRYLILDA
jgi:hypothetical protein